MYTYTEQTNTQNITQTELFELLTEFDGDIDSVFDMTAAEFADAYNSGAVINGAFWDGSVIYVCNNELALQEFIDNTLP